MQRLVLNQRKEDIDLSRQTKQGIVAFLIIVFILVVDQIIKIEVKTTMTYGMEDVRVLIPKFLYLQFVENNGMAAGMSFIPKVFLTVFRMFAVVALVVYLSMQIRMKARWLYVVLLSMVVAGATGNIIDCVFYGQIFTDSSFYTVAEMVPFGEGTRPLLQGLVVDMFHMKFWDFDFFPFIYNFADASISVSVISILLFCRKELTEALG